MRRFNKLICIVICHTLVFAIFPGQIGVSAQDFVEGNSLTGGGSAFVFRESRKRPQAGGGIAAASSGESAGGVVKARRARNNAQIAAAAKKRKTAAAAARKKAIVAAANKKLQLSNTLTAKAESNVEAGQTDLAITNYRAALVQNPKNSRAINGLSDALTDKGIAVAGDTNNIASTIYFNEAIKLDKANDVAYAKLGAVCDANGQKDQAITNYEKAVALNPELAELQGTLGLAYVENGDIAKAEAALAKASASGADTVDTRTLKALVLYKQNNNLGALAAFDKLLELDRRNAAAHYYRGQTLARMQQDDKAIGAYKTALEIEPGYSPASFEIGVSFYNAGKYNDAAIAYQSVVAANPTNYQAHANLASSYRQLEKYVEANAEYKIAFEGIKTADLYSEWGYCLGKVNDWTNSVAHLKTARELSPTAIDNSNIGWAYYNSGASKTVAKDDAGAKADYDLGKTYLQKAVEQDPKLAAAQLNLGSTHNGLGEFQLAVNVLNTALGLRGNWGIAMNQLGLGYRGLNDLTNAVSMFKRVVDLDGGNTYGLFNLGEAYNASGNKKEAKKINDKLKKLDPRLAATLDGIFSGRISIPGGAIPTVPNIPKVPKIPKFPY